MNLPPDGPLFKMIVLSDSPDVLLQWKEHAYPVADNKLNGHYFVAVSYLDKKSESSLQVN